MMLWYLLNLFFNLLRPFLPGLCSLFFRTCQSRRCYFFCFGCACLGGNVIPYKINITSFSVGQLTVASIREPETSLNFSMHKPWKKRFSLTPMGVMLVVLSRVFVYSSSWQECKLQAEWRRAIRPQKNASTLSSKSEEKTTPTWVCASCTYVNDASLSTCGRFIYPRAHELALA
jgi:hypothetical protein